jgi:hypothetical protein
MPNTPRPRRRLVQRAAAAALVLALAGAAGGPGPVAAASPCAALTPAAVDQLVAQLTVARGLADQDVALNAAGGAYAVAATYHRDNLVAALQKATELRGWLTANGLGSPYVSNATAAYNVHGLARDVVGPLHHARHWATISAVYHKASATQPIDRSGPARASYEATTQALTLVEALGADAGRCYLSGYFPSP